jgi:hypothetical protein
MDGCRKRHGNNPTGGRFETDEDVVVALKILLEAGADISRKTAKRSREDEHSINAAGWTEDPRAAMVKHFLVKVFH